MNFRLPVVATDFDFNREAAAQIKIHVDSEALREEMKQKMDSRLTLFGDYDKHFNDILEFLVKVGEGKV